MSERANRFRIGCALSSNTWAAFMRPSLVEHAKDRRIDFVPIDVAKPLLEQGPFDCILHKSYTQDWYKELNDFSSKNPNVIIVDEPSAIEKIHNRGAMLDVMIGLKNIPQFNGIPKQLLIENSGSLVDQATAVKELRFPIIAKPMSVDGSSESHDLLLVFGPDGLKGLEPPIVLQEFINHGGVMFKVYVAGEHVKCVKRKSLPDISEALLASGGSMPFSQISNSAIAASVGFDTVELPESKFVEEVAKEMRKALGLDLFNFDMINDGRNGYGYLVFDINYFPGFEKLPSYETFMTDFFWEVLHRKKMKEEVEGITLS